MPQQADNLTGLWNGQFSYPTLLPPEFFTATLLETPDWLSGSIHEVHKAGRSAGKPLYATLIGSRNGRQISFVKTYESESRRHSIKYAGALSSDGCEIAGEWTIPGHWSGAFLMIRASAGAISKTRRISEPIAAK